MTRVAKRWHTAFYSEPSLWRSLTISRPELLHAPSSTSEREALAWRALKRLVPCVGSWVEAAQLVGAHCVGRQWHALLEQLQPGMLSSLSLSDCAHLPGPALQRLTALTALRLQYVWMPHYHAWDIASMRQLRALSISASGVPLSILRAAAQLTLLTELSLESAQPMGPGEALVLRHLSQLRCLELLNALHPYAPPGNVPVAPPPACFPHLRRHKLQHYDVGFSI